MQYFFLTLIFLFGAALGSFILVIADRYNTGLPFFRGRSICFSCGIEIRSKNLFPIFSFLLLKGRCQQCGSKIPKEAFFVEILMGFLSVLAAFKSGLFASSLFFNLSWMMVVDYLLLTSVFAIILLISIYDLRHFIIPDSFLLFLLLFIFLYNSYFVILDSFSLTPYLMSFISGISLALPFLLIFLISRGRWLGFGDVKYILVIGFLLGFSRGLSAVILAFWIGAAFSLLVLFLRRLKPHISLPLLPNNFTIKSEIPFGPFISVGAIISFYFNADLFQIHSLFNFF